MSDSATQAKLPLSDIDDDDRVTITPEGARELIRLVEERIDIAEAAGGIPVEDVGYNDSAFLMILKARGWWFDELSWYYLPPHFQFPPLSQN